MEEGRQEGASYFRLSALSVMSGCLTWVVFHSSLGMIAWFAVVGAVCLGSLSLFAMRVFPQGGVEIDDSPPLRRFWYLVVGMTILMVVLANRGAVCTAVEDNGQFFESCRGVRTNISLDEYEQLRRSQIFLGGAVIQISLALFGLSGKRR
jgi:hypothetical protein